MINSYKEVGGGMISAVNFARRTDSKLFGARQEAIVAVKEKIANLAFDAGEKMQDVSDQVGFTLVKFGYLFVNEPTIIENTKISRLSATEVTITWTTNHPATGKVNFGESLDYGQDIQSDKRVTYHEFTIADLEPNTTYYYEVMSQNKNYVYDANHTFVTPAE